MITASNPDACILIVDDEPSNVRVLKRVLAVAGYQRVTAITDPRDAIARFAEIEPDILLLDLHMPKIDGLAVMERLRAGMPASEYFPILMLTGDASPQACQRALAVGASDFVSKPFDMHEVLIRIKNLLATRSLHRQVAEHAHELELKVRERTAELGTAQLDTITRLALAAEFRDDATGRHTQRVGALSELLARAMGWSDTEAALLGLAAPLHDVGKIGIPDGILCKAAMLTVRERKTMEEHTTIGAKILSGGRSRLIQLAEKVALSHHERWDGQGYPNRTRGPAIPPAARIVAVADFFDATVHDRVYRKAWPMDQVLAAIAAMSGSAFDPAVAELCSRPEVQESMVLSSRALAPVDVSPGSGAVTRQAEYFRNRSEPRTRRRRLV
jgi:putative two-component system response regulator